MLQLILLCVCIILSCANLIAFSIMMSKLETIGIAYHQILKYTKQNVSLSETQKEIVESYRDTALKIYQVYDLTNVQYEEISNRVDKCIELTAKIADEYNKLGKAFKMCEDRYSDYYEQAKEMKELILELKTALEERQMPKYWCGPGDIDEPDDELEASTLIEKGA